MQDCILDKGNGLAEIMKVDEGKRELPFIEPGRKNYRAFRIRQYALKNNGTTGVYLIASEDLLEYDEALELVENLNPEPIESMPDNLE